MLQACLGTCVGVAVFDATAGVGGIIHLLLPEPVSSWSVDQPEKYAVTGVPLFLKHLFDRGGNCERMQAVVAGGALVGPLTSQDISLDIGGRTAEKAYIALHSAGIAVKRAETGGFFTCCLELDMQRWTCDITPSGFDISSHEPGSVIPVTEDLQQAIETIRPIPQVALKVLRIIEDGTYDIDKISEEVKKDQVISARTIQLCNSAMFTKHRDVVSLDHALVFLGQDLFIKLVISAAVQSYYSQCANGYSLCKGGLYHHAVGTAMIAEKIAGMTAKALSGVAYTAGLLHDIGKVVLDQYITGAYPTLYREFQDRQSEIIDVETRVLGMDHTRVGEKLADKWSLPAPLAKAIRFHHRPEEDGNNDSLTTIVYLADLLMSRFHTGLELERMGTDYLIEHLSQLDLSTGQLYDLVDLIPGKVFGTAMETTESL
ncbi:MAG: HDOD domain-containing protein, partial [Desulfobacteraceae bacterium]|jgi:putative nucleotidyltransferase with HDIG domain|nr:HDOD domain-containing protein [Desulfobacteraceae bacterium]